MPLTGMQGYWKREKIFVSLNRTLIRKPDITAPGVNILAATGPLNRVYGWWLCHAFRNINGNSSCLWRCGTPQALHPDWSPAAIKSALVTTAWRNGPSGLPIFAEGFPKKLADPFDFGGGIVNPNGATDPGNSTTLTRTVTNVGAPESIYRVVIQPPIGVVITVNPDVLVFNSMTKSITFKVTVSSTHHVNTGYYFGSLTWTDGVHEVRSPLSVRTEIIPIIC
ncbi:Subtilisin-like protease SBT3.7 [Vitis vinifera]|uniref:Subtilisin-like protease SBT3.7 n=1 Tax=Vitis vinifera TaxID=29760 RepID=A0A438BUY2_VITVI|nr:Subtilisin-like protease SBT3.7 [Vitis vinifera]